MFTWKMQTVCTCFHRCILLLLLLLLLYDMSFTCWFLHCWDLIITDSKFYFILRTTNNTTLLFIVCFSIRFQLFFFCPICFVMFLIMMIDRSHINNWNIRSGMACTHARTTACLIPGFLFLWGGVGFLQAFGNRLSRR
jgi:hypothetical protein